MRPSLSSLKSLHAIMLAIMILCETSKALHYLEIAGSQRKIRVQMLNPIIVLDFKSAMLMQRS